MSIGMSVPPQLYDIFAFGGGLNFRYNILDRKWSPFLMISAGYDLWSFGYRENNERLHYQYGEGYGFLPYLAFYAGCNYKLSPKNMLFFALGFETPLHLHLKVGYKF